MIAAIIVLMIVLLLVVSGWRVYEFAHDPNWVDLGLAYAASLIAYYLLYTLCGYLSQ
jgi:hypothetical protein